MLQKSAKTPALRGIFILIVIVVFGIAGFILYRIRSKQIAVPVTKSSITAPPKVTSPFDQAEQDRLTHYVNKLTRDFLEVQNTDMWVYGEATGRKKLFSDFSGGEKNVAEYYALINQAITWADTTHPPLVEHPVSGETTYTRPAFITVEENGTIESTIRADFVQFLTDTVTVSEEPYISIPSLFATRACLADGQCDKTECNYDISRLPCVPNGYYLRNRDPETKLFPIYNQTVIEVPTKDDMTTLEKVSMQEFINRMQEASNVPGVNPLFSLEVKNDQLTRLSWIYTP